ncbi:MAG: J domain-containing protein [Chloroflexota bacterium]|nr:J domain-containing protein [Chloroflexota bacterium]
MAGDYYKVLGIDRNAGEKEVRAAFRKLARQYHPDVNHGEPGADERFKEINEAHEVLSNPESRRLYDRYGERWRDVQRGGEPLQGGRQWRTQTIDPEAFEEFFGSRSGGFFESFFRPTHGARQRGPGAQRPSALEQHVELTLEEAFHGATRNLQVTGQSPCAACHGIGVVDSNMCQACLGQGYSYQPVRGEVSIPAGVDNGSRVRVSPGGQQVVLVVSVQPHATFERKGDDLSTEVSVPLYDAILGAEVVVPTLTGQVALKLPPETQNGRVFRLGRQGMPKLSAPAERGNLFVTIRTELPADLSDEERALFERLQQLRNSSGDTR